MQPRILDRTVTTVSPWMRVVAKEVDFARGCPTEIYHCLRQADYVTMLARTRSGLYPLVCQYRPAVETFTWELPAGLVDADELPEQAARRELREEAGIEALRVLYLGATYPDSGRMENHMHAFYIEATDPVAEALTIEEGLTVEFVDGPTLRQRVLGGQFRMQLHLGVLAQALVYGLPDLTRDLTATLQ